MTYRPHFGMDPYPGIKPFSYDDARIYFGRERLIEDMIERLHQDHLLTIAGPSGSGKSSLIRAGLLPKISATETDISHRRIIVMRPGNEPLRHLIDALAQDRPPSERSLDRDLTSDGWLALFRETLEQSSGRFLLVVDQLEEIVRTGWRLGFLEQCVGFVAALADIRAHVLPVMYAILSVRAEFLGECGRFAGLTELINSSVYLLPPLGRKERLSAIAQPLAVTGGRYEQGFADQLVSECDDLYPDDLVLMQHVLARMWARARAIQPDHPMLTRSGYEAVGGLDRSLDLHAEEILAALPDDRQALAPRLFRALTGKALDAVYIRHPDTVEHLAQLLSVDVAQTRQVLLPFHQAGFLVASDLVGDPESFIDISHEVVIRRWDRLRQWAQIEADAGDMYSRLLESAQRHSEGKSSLLRHPELRQVLTWADGEKPSPTWAERYGGRFDLVMGYLSDSAKAMRQHAAETNAGREQPPHGVFICYRRDDSAGDARFIADSLIRKFGRRQVFVDIDGIAPGSHFEEVLHASLRSSAVALVLIGIHWLDIKDREGLRRLNNSGDHVRREIRDAINSGLTVIPVLLGRAAMPEERDLPPDIKRLAKLQCVMLKHETFQADLNALTKRLTESVRPPGVALRLTDGLTRALRWMRLPPRP